MERRKSSHSRSNAPLVVCIGLGYGLMLTTFNANAFSFISVATWIQKMWGEASAMAISTKQTAVSANLVAQTENSSKLALAQAMGTLTLTKRIVNTRLQYDGLFGQPPSIQCENSKEGELRAAAVEQSDRDRNHLMNSFAASRISSSATGDYERRFLHKTSYCTMSEAKSGFCQLSPNGMQGWDINYGGAFAETKLAPEGELAGMAYVAMVSDVRAPSAIDCESASCAGAATRQLQLSAASAMVANSLTGQVMDRRVPMITGK